MAEAVTYVEAIRLALQDEMRRDERVFCIGEDIGVYGGAFKVTRGFLEEFGARRVVDTPIAESLITGAAIGAAVRGLRPVAEMQFADFVTCGFSQLVVNAATFHYRLGVSVPMVVRLPSGGGVGGGPYHSRNPEAWFCHSPGLKVLAPATAADAWGLMKAAIRDPDPVIYLEQKFLYRREKAVLPLGADGDHLVPIGTAAVRREGTRATILTYANGVSLSLDAAERAAVEDGLSVEVVDLRSLVPLDREAVVASVRKTGRALVVHEATLTAGFGAELAAIVADECFEWLDAPVQRVAAIDAPTPAEKSLEEFFRPSAERVLRALRALCSY